MMDSFEVDVPPVKEFRHHILMTLHFIHTYLCMAKLESFPYEDIEKIINGVEVLRLHDFIKEAGADLPCSLTANEMLTVYASHDISSKILVSEYGEFIGAEITKRVTDDHHLKEFEKLRNYFILANNHMIKDIEIKMPNLPGLADVKTRLEQLTW